MAPSRRRSVYLTERMDAVLDVSQEDGESLSGRLACVVGRYGEVVEASAPDLTRAEWCVVLDACNGWATPHEPAEWLSAGLALQIADALWLESLGEKHGLDADQSAGLVQKLKELGPAGAAAVIERAERFWRRSHLGLDEAMAEAGIVPQD